MGLAGFFPSHECKWAIRCGAYMVTGYLAKSATCMVNSHVFPTEDQFNKSVGVIWSMLAVQNRGPYPTIECNLVYNTLLGSHRGSGHPSFSRKLLPR